jgi:predicted esterase
VSAPREHHIEVTRTARYWTLGAEDAPTEVWFVLHGYRQLAERFLRRFVPLDDGSRLVVAPEGLSRFYVEQEVRRHGPASVVGATWMTREDREHEIHDYVGYLDRLAERVLSGVPGGPSVTVLGFSQGVATACRWTVLGAARPARLVLWGDWVPPDLPLERVGPAWAGTRVLQVRGDADPIFRNAAGVRAEEERLAKAGVATEIVRYDGGHDIDTATLQRLAAS